MGTEELLKKLPRDGFLKICGENPALLPRDRKIALIRKGNELFNEGKYDLAKRAFITAGYTDGLIRLGDHYYKNQMPLEAFRMYWLAPYSKGVENLVERMAYIMRNWLKEEEKKV